MQTNAEPCLSLPINLLSESFTNLANHPIGCLSKSLNSAAGIIPAILSITTKSTPASITDLATSIAASPFAGWEANNKSGSTPHFRNQDSSRDISVSIHTAVPPDFCTDSTAFIAR